MMNINAILIIISLLICVSIFIFVFLILRIIFVKILMTTHVVQKKRQPINIKKQQFTRQQINPFITSKGTFFLVHKLMTVGKAERYLTYDATHFTIFHRIREKI